MPERFRPGFRPDLINAFQTQSSEWGNLDNLVPIRLVVGSDLDIDKKAANKARIAAEKSLSYSDLIGKSGMQNMRRWEKR